MNIVIVGGGIVGLSVATELATAGDDVTVVEKSVPGSEASGAAAGMLAPQLEVLGPGPLLELCLRSRELYPDWVRRIQTLSGVDVGYRECGTLEIASSEAHLNELDSTSRWQRNLGLPCELLDDAAVRRLEPQLAPCHGALHLPEDHQVDPPKLMRALPIAATRVGAKLRRGQVNGVTEHGGRVSGVDLDGERLDADAVIVAAGSWSSLVPGARIAPRSVLPMRGQMLELRTRLPVLQRTVAGGGVYLVPRTDGRLVAGSTQELVGFDKSVTAGGIAGILSGLLKLCPALAEADLHATWAGFRPWTEDALPLLGEGPLPGLWLATGHFRNGILLAPVTASLISQQLRGKAPELDMTPFRYSRFPL